MRSADNSREVSEIDAHVSAVIGEMVRSEHYDRDACRARLNELQERRVRLTRAPIYDRIDALLRGEFGARPL